MRDGMMTRPKVLVAGVGNIFQGDDAFGVFAVRELIARDLPEEVRVTDFGIRTYDLAFAMMDGYDAVILVDATARGGTPGTLYVIDPEIDAVEAGQAVVGGHSMTPSMVLRMISAIEGFGGRVVVVGCEPATLECVDGRVALSRAVEAALPESVEIIQQLIRDILASAPAVARCEDDPVQAGQYPPEQGGPSNEGLWSVS